MESTQSFFFPLSQGVDEIRGEDGGEWGGGHDDGEQTGGDRNRKVASEDLNRQKFKRDEKLSGSAKKWEKRKR